MVVFWMREFLLPRTKVVDGAETVGRARGRTTLECNARRPAEARSAGCTCKAEHTIDTQK
eukprot:4053176-Pleurochrysis_carterae.AAC.2